VMGEVRLARADVHSRRLLPAIDFLLQSLDLRPDDVEGYAVTAGPGSFTGLRVGLATVQGLALASGRPALGLCTLDVLAARAVGAAPLLVALIEAGREEIYAARYDASGARLGEPRAGTLAQLLADLAGEERIAFVGDAVVAGAHAIRAAVPNAILPDRSLFLGGTLGRIAEPRLVAGEGKDAGALQPLYLRAAHIR
jgi:tRNA threonylcarbamoyladenosine biosynthesis protein TsaB